jgi:hypothetical protein
MKRKSITRFKLNPKKPPKSDWRAFDAMSEEARHRAAVSDPDALPATKAQLAGADLGGHGKIAIATRLPPRNE